MTGAYAVQKVLAFIFFSLVARSMSSSAVGVYTLALSLASVAGVFADFGITSMNVRELSQDPYIEKKLSAMFSVKLVCACFSFFGLLAFSFFWYRDIQHFFAICCAGIVMCSDTIQSTFFAGLRSRNDLRHEALSIVFAQCLTVGLGCFVAFLFPAPWLFILIFACGSILSGAYAYLILRKLYGVRVFWNFSRKIFWQTVTQARSFGFSAVAGRMYGAFDSIMLHAMRGAAMLGAYSVSVKIITALQCIPYAFGSSLYPAFSALPLARDERARREALFYRSGGLLLLLGAACTVSIFLFAIPLIPFIFGESYRVSVAPLFFLALTLPFTFYTFVTGALLNALRLQYIQTSIVFAALVVNMMTNIYLIPQFGAMGAALSAVVSSIFWAWCGAMALASTGSVSMRIFLRHGACLGMLAGGVFCAWKLQFVSIFLSIFFAVIFFGIMAQAFSLIQYRDLRQLFRVGV
jgi:O-antigen/teichoic acid export membrane protein